MLFFLVSKATFQMLSFMVLTPLLGFVSSSCCYSFASIHKHTHTPALLPRWPSPPWQSAPTTCLLRHSDTLQHNVFNGLVASYLLFCPLIVCPLLAFCVPGLFVLERDINALIWPRFLIIKETVLFLQAFQTGFNAYCCLKPNIYGYF